MDHTGFRVMARRCNECLFGRNRIVDETRKTDVLAECARDGSFFQCHKATIGGVEGGCCRGYYDVSEDGIVVVVKRLGLPVQWIDPVTLEDVTGDA